MLSAVRSLPLVLLLALPGAGTWAAQSPKVRVEAFVGEAVVVFENIDCPEEVIRVPTGDAAETDPDKCEAVVGLSNVPDRVSDVVWAIAKADLDNPAVVESIKSQLAGLTTGEQALVVAVLHNNATTLGVDRTKYLNTIRLIVTVNPKAASTVVLTASVLDPGNADAIKGAALEGAPGQADNIGKAADAAEEIRQDFTGNQPGQGADGETPGGVGKPEEEGPEVVEIKDKPTPPKPNPPNNNVPPGGAVPTPSPTPTPTPTATPTPTPTATPTPTPTPPPSPE